MGLSSRLDRLSEPRFALLLFIPAALLVGLFVIPPILSTYLHFLPKIAHAYWQAVDGGDLATAARIIRDFDHPWMAFADTLSGGFDAMYHGAQEIFGIAGRWRRPPYHSLDDAEMERLREFFAGLPNLDAAA